MRNAAWDKVTDALGYSIAKPAKKIAAMCEAYAKIQPVLQDLQEQT